MNVADLLTENAATTAPRVIMIVMLTAATRDVMIERNKQMSLQIG